MYSATLHEAAIPLEPGKAAGALQADEYEQPPGYLRPLHPEAPEMTGAVQEMPR